SGCKANTDGYGLTMKQSVRVPRPCLKSMAKCVAKVETGAITGLSFIAGNDVSLHLDGAPDSLHQGRRLVLEHLLPAFLQPCEKFRITEQTVFRDLCIASTHLPYWQSREHFCVGENEARLMEGPD